MYNVSAFRGKLMLEVPVLRLSSYYMIGMQYLYMLLDTKRLGCPWSDAQCGNLLQRLCTSQSLKGTIACFSFKDILMFAYCVHLLCFLHDSLEDVLICIMLANRIHLFLFFVLKVGIKCVFTFRKRILDQFSIKT